MRATDRNAKPLLLLLVALGLSVGCGRGSEEGDAPHGHADESEHAEAGAHEPEIPDSVRLTGAAIAESGIQTWKVQSMDLEHLLAPTSVQPRPYQARIVRRAVELFAEQGVRSVLIDSPTGSGKTVMALLIAKALQQRLGVRVGWVAMRRFLLTQARADASDRSELGFITRDPPGIGVRREERSEVVRRLEGVGVVEARQRVHEVDRRHERLPRVRDEHHVDS